MEPFIRNKIRQLPDTAIRFQCLTWQTTDQPLMISVNGVTEAGESVCCHIEGFQTHFFVELVNEDEYDAVSTAIELLNQKKFTSSMSLTLELMKRADGYHDGELYPFVKVAVGSLEAFRGLSNIIKSGIYIGNERVKLSVHEASFRKAHLRLCHQREISPTGWIEIRRPTLVKKRSTRAQIEIVSRAADISPAPVAVSSLVEASFDLEVFASVPGFPSPELDDNVITHIGMTITTKNGRLKTVFSLLPCEKINEPGILHVRAKTEKQLLEQWKKCLVMCDPDVIYSYNGDRFDWPYVLERCRKLNVEPDFGRWPGRKVWIYSKPDKPGEKKKRVNDSRDTIHVDGRVNIDVYWEMRKTISAAKYTLGVVSTQELGETKEEMSHKTIFKAWREKDAALSRDVAHYCVTDTVLPQLLAEKFKIVPSLFAMGNVAIVDYETLIYGGQTAKCISLVMKQAAKQNFVFPDLRHKEKREDGKKEYQGATVLTPVANVYRTPTVVLDFASLYPSIIRSLNICFTTITKVGGREVDVGGEVGKVYFMQDVESLIPFIQTQLAKERKAAKAEMKKYDKDSFEYDYWNGTQTALKLVANSIYGFLGTSIEGIPIAASITATGRLMIHKTSAFMESRYKCKTIYGDTDSVFLNFPGLSLAEAIDVGTRAANEANTVLFKKPVELEYEKVYNPMIMFTKKKRYMAYKFEKVNDKMRVEKKGVSSVRGDSWPMGNAEFDKIAGMVLGGESEADIQEEVRDFLFDVRQGDGYAVQDFVLKMKLNSGYKTPETMIPHVVVEKMKTRNEQDIPEINDIVEYVVIKRPGFTKISARVEYPEWLRTHKKIEIDRDYYVDRFASAVTTILELFMNKSDINILFATGQKQKRLTDFWKK